MLLRTVFKLSALHVTVWSFAVCEVACGTWKAEAVSGGDRQHFLENQEDVAARCHGSSHLQGKPARNLDGGGGPFQFQGTDDES